MSEFRFRLRSMLWTMVGCGVACRTIHWLYQSFPEFRAIAVAILVVGSAALAAGGLWAYAYHQAPQATTTLSVVVLLVVFPMFALVTFGLQRAREVARWNQCQMNLFELGERVRFADQQGIDHRRMWNDATEWRQFHAILDEHSPSHRPALARSLPVP